MKNSLPVKLTIAIFMMFLAFSCKKKEDAPVNNTPAQAKYYFNFNLDGVAKTYRSNTLQTGHGFFQDQIGGYVLNGENVGGDAMGFTVWEKDFSDSLTHTEVIALQGQSLFFDNPNYMVELNLQITEGADFENYTTIDESNHSFKTTITSVALIGSGTSINGKYLIYDVKGTCSGKVENVPSTKTKTITNGDFYVRLTKGIL